MLAFTKSLFQAKKKKKKPKPAAEGGRPREEEEEVAPTITQPRDLPPLRTVEGDLTGYDVEFEDEAPRKRVVAELDDDDETSDPRIAARRGPSRRRSPAHRRDPDLIPERSRVWSDEDEEEPTSYGVHAPEVVPIETHAARTREAEGGGDASLESRRCSEETDRGLESGAARLPRPTRERISAMIIASGLCFVVGVMVRICRDFNPLD